MTVGLCRSDERKVISNQIWEAQGGGSRIRLSVLAIRGERSFSRSNDAEMIFLQKRNYIRGRIFGANIYSFIFYRFIVDEIK